MEKITTILIGIAIFITYVVTLFGVGFACSCRPHDYQENVTSSYVISCIVGAAVTVALLVEKGVLSW